MCYDLNLDGYGPHPSQGDKYLSVAGTKISKCSLSAKSRRVSVQWQVLKYLSVGTNM